MFNFLSKLNLFKSKKTTKKTNKSTKHTTTKKTTRKRIRIQTRTRTHKNKYKNNIKVLTFNVFWAAMMASKKSAEKGKLADICYTLKDSHPDNKNVCLHNVVEFFDDVIKEYGMLDFIAIQEAHGWKEIVKNSSHLNKMGYIHHSINLTTGATADFITLYNHKKYKLLGFKYGDLSEGRQYHILFLTNIKNHTNYIFINFHNEHNLNQSSLSEGLSNDLSNGILCLNDKTRHIYENAEKMKIVDIKDLLNKYYHIITAGDTNDHGRFDYWKGIKPFNIEPLNSINVSTQNHKPPNTCCSLYRLKKGEDSKYGDYIMISDELQFEKSNFIPDAFEHDFTKSPTSDHLPSMAIIKH
jgi:hypothetical protein